MFRLVNPLTSLIFGGDDRAKITFTLLAINWIGALSCLLVLRALIERVCDRQWIVILATLGFLFCSAFLNYGQTGSAYVPGIALILTGALILVRDSEKPGNKLAVLAAAALIAGGVSLWVPLVLIVPGAVMLPLFLGEWDRRTMRQAC